MVAAWVEASINQVTIIEAVFYSDVKIFLLYNIISWS